MEILVLEASTTSAKAMLYHTEDRSFEVKVRAYTGNYEDVTIHNCLLYTSPSPRDRG